MGKNDRHILDIMCISRVHRKIIFCYFEGKSLKITVELQKISMVSKKSSKK